MKKSIIVVLSLLTVVWGVGMYNANATTPDMRVAADAGQAEIEFDTLRINLGTFAEKDAVQKCTFAFTNTGDAPLVINQAFASCGCTVPTYTKDPVKPGEKGKIEVTYNGKGKVAGHFSKTITVRSNAKTEIVRLTIEGTMTK
ncbi:MAG: DUF1573 domain-containing protein [Bacteroidaceae bacterium]|nr:DUF1573 domain-containing protein [Bacteroidaceae bacterium]